MDPEEVVRQHLEALPAAIKEQISGMLELKKEITAKSTANLLKATVGTIKDLFDQQEAGDADQGGLLQELQEIQQSLDKAQAELKSNTEEYCSGAGTLWHWEEDLGSSLLPIAEQNEVAIKASTPQEEAEEYRKWLVQGESKGLRALEKGTDSL